MEIKRPETPVVCCSVAWIRPVRGLTAFCTMVTGILAVIFGNLALGRIARSQGREKGRGMAIAGIVLGWVSIAIIGVFAIIWFGYNLSNG